MLFDGEKLSPIGNGINAITSDEHSFGTDAILLAYFSAPGQSGLLCDLGTGCGIIPLLWSRSAGRRIDAFEIRPQAAELALRAAKLNGLTGIHVYCQDIRLIDKSFNCAYSLVTCNPPYKPAGTGAMSTGEADRYARHETMCTLEDVVRTGSRLIKGTGRLCVCHRPERLVDLLVFMRLYHVEPKRIRLVQQRLETTPWLVLCEGKKSTKPGLVVEAPLIIEDGNGRYTAEMNKIYGG